jgi:hypothetical protein
LETSPNISETCKNVLKTLKNHPKRPAAAKHCEQFFVGVPLELAANRS